MQTRVVRHNKRNEKINWEEFKAGPWQSIKVYTQSINYDPRFWPWRKIGRYFIGLVIGIFLIFGIPYIASKALAKSLYKRGPMEDYLKTVYTTTVNDTVKDVNVTQAIGELCVVSYSLTHDKARLYSKYMAYFNETTYGDISLWDAACATSAAPAYWPLKKTDNNVPEVLVDGGLIENNPAVYAMNIGMMRAMNAELVGKKKVRIISIGTGDSPLRGKYTQKYGDSQEVRTVYWMKQMSYLSMATASTAATHASSQLADNSLRVDLKSKISMADKTKVNELIAQGIALAEKFKPKLDELCDILVEENKDKLWMKELIHIL